MKWKFLWLAFRKVLEFTIETSLEVRQVTVSLQLQNRDSEVQITFLTVNRSLRGRTLFLREDELQFDLIFFLHHITFKYMTTTNLKAAVYPIWKYIICVKFDRANLLKRKLLTPKASVSNLGRDTEYPDWSFSWLLLLLPSECRDSIFK